MFSASSECGKGGENRSMLLEGYVPDYENYDYEKEWSRRSIEDLAEKRIIGRWLTHSEYCLELGGGFGRITKILEPYFQKVFMIDYSLKNLASASRRLENTALVRGDIRRLPFEDNAFDCIVVVRVLHLIEDIPRMMDEIVRVGRDGATLILGVPNTRLGRYRGIRANETVLIGPQKHKARVYSLNAYRHRSLVLIRRQAAGIFDNPIGRRLDRIPALYNVDVATSWLWSIKPELFMKFKVRKHE